MDEKGTPSYTPAEGQQIPPTEYAPAEPQPQQIPAAQPQYTYTPYGQAQQPQQAQPQYAQPQYQQYAQPQQGQYNPYAQYQQPQQGQYAQPQYAPYGQQPQYAPYGQQPQYAPQQPQKAPKAKRGGAHSGGPGGPKLPNIPKWLIPAAAGAVALIVVIVLAVSLLGGGTEDKIADAAVGTIERLSENEIVTTAQQAINGGSLTISIDGTDVLSELSGMDMEATAEMKFWLDVEGGKTALQVTADIMDTAIDAAIYLNADNIAVVSEVLLGDDAYGINIAKIADNLEDSVFGPDGPYYIGDEAYDLFIAALNGEVIDTKAGEKLANTGMKLAENYVDFVIKTVFKHALVEKENDTVKIGGEKVKAQIITVTIDAPAMIEIMADVLEKIDGDKKLNNYLYDLAEYLDDAQESADMDEVDFADIVDSFYDSVEDMLDTVDDAREDAEDANMEIEFEFWLKGGDLLGLKADLAGTELEVKIGPDPKSPELISIEVNDGWSTMSVVYEVEENSKEKFEAVFSMSEDDYELVNLTIDYDKEDGDWELGIYDGWDTYGIAGNLEINKDVYTITFSGLIGEDIPEEVNMVFEMITITLDTDDKAPDAPKYTDILTLDEDEFNEVIETIVEAVEELGSSMGMGGVVAGSSYADMPAVAYEG